MGWLAWSGTPHDPVAHPSVTPHMSLEHGALMIEAPLPSETRAATLLEVTSLHPVPSLLRIQSIPGEGFSVLISHGDEMFHALLSHSLRARTDHFRLTLNWDARSGAGMLSIEHPGDDRIFTKALAGCIAMPGALILGALTQMRVKGAADTIDMLAFHKGLLSIGPGATLDYHTPVLTPRGYAKIGTLKPGDTVTTATGDIVPVLGCLSKTVPASGSFAPVRLRAPYFGLQSDLVMAGTQRMIAGGSDVEYTFGRDTVLIPARHLVNGTAAIPQPSSGIVTYYQLLLPENEAIIASDVVLESLFVGRLRRRKDLFDYSTLAQMPRHLLPEHAALATQVLRPFEAITLASMRAA